MEADVAHHRDDDGVVGEPALVAKLQRAEGDHPVAVDDVAEMIDSDHTIAVAVEGEAQIGCVIARRLPTARPDVSRRSDR